MELTAIVVAGIGAITGVLAFVGGLKKNKADVAAVVQEVYDKVVKRLKAENAELSKKMEKLDNDIRARDHQIDELNTKLKKLDSEIMARDERIADLGNRLRELDDEIVARDVTIEDLVQSMKAMKTASNKERDNFQEEIAELRQEVACLRVWAGKLFEQLVDAGLTPVPFDEIQSASDGK